MGKLFHRILLFLVLLNLIIDITAEIKKEFIIIVSAQRSGSTELADHLATGCNVGLNEFFHEQDIYEQTGKAIDLIGSKLFYSRRNNTIQALEKAKEKGCDRLNGYRRKDGKPSCKECSVSIKLFPTHHVQNKELMNLLSNSRTAVIVLERPPHARYCSWKVAQDRGDWTTHPSETHHHIPCNPCTEENVCEEEYLTFTKKHKKWFQDVRTIVEKKEQMRIEIPFSIWIGPYNNTVLNTVMAFASIDPNE